MSRTIALDPVVTRTGTVAVTTPPPAKEQTIALDPICRTITGTQTAIPPAAE